MKETMLLFHRLAENISEVHAYRNIPQGESLRDILVSASPLITYLLSTTKTHPITSKIPQSGPKDTKSTFIRVLCLYALLELCIIFISYIHNLSFMDINERAHSIPTHTLLLPKIEPLPTQTPSRSDTPSPCPKNSAASNLVVLEDWCSQKNKERQCYARVRERKCCRRFSLFSRGHCNLQTPINKIASPQMGSILSPRTHSWRGPKLCMLTAKMTIVAYHRSLLANDRPLGADNSLISTIKSTERTIVLA